MFSEKVKYIGVDDTDLDLFESQYHVPQGMCYNSYVLMADSITVMDTVDRRKTDEWMAKLEAALNGAKPTYLVVQHVEPDHSGSVGAFLQKYPDTQVVKFFCKPIILHPIWFVAPPKTFTVFFSFEYLGEEPSLISKIAGTFILKVKFSIVLLPIPLFGVLITLKRLILSLEL